MAFLDNLVNRTKSMGNQLSDKARDTGEQYRLESEIRKLNGEIESAFTTLGKALFASRVDGLETDFDAPIREIIAMKEKIEEKRRRIEAIKSQIVCPNCGKLMPEGTLICTACGRSMKKRETPDDGKLRCPQCGKVIESGDAFCMKCGAPLQKPETEETETL